MATTISPFSATGADGLPPNRLPRFRRRPSTDHGLAGERGHRRRLLVWAAGKYLQPSPRQYPDCPRRYAQLEVRAPPLVEEGFLLLLLLLLHPFRCRLSAGRDFPFRRAIQHCTCRLKVLHKIAQMHDCPFLDGRRWSCHQAHLDLRVQSGFCYFLEASLQIATTTFFQQAQVHWIQEFRVVRDPFQEVLPVRRRSGVLLPVQVSSDSTLAHISHSESAIHGVHERGTSIRACAFEFGVRMAQVRFPVELWRDLFLWRHMDTRVRSQD